jgi:hypothetical protein
VAREQSYPTVGISTAVLVSPTSVMLSNVSLTGGVFFALCPG